MIRVLTAAVIASAIATIAIFMVDEGLTRPQNPAATKLDRAHGMCIGHGWDLPYRCEPGQQPGPDGYCTKEGYDECIEIERLRKENGKHEAQEQENRDLDFVRGVAGMKEGGK